MKITLLGTGSPLPDPNRAGPCTLVQAGAQNVMVDCGRGALMRLMAAGVVPPAVSTLLITHLHSDHITDLNDLVTSRWVMSPVNVPLVVFGPRGTRAMVDAMLVMLALDQQYRHDHHDDLRANGPLTVDVCEVVPGDSFAVGDAQVTVHETDHRPVTPSIGFRIQHDGKVAALAGDTIPCSGLDEMCRDADAYVQTVIRDDMVKFVADLVPTGERFRDILDYHSTVEQAAQTAARNNVKNLVLTHYVPALQAGQEDDWRSRAAAHFGGNIVLGPDLTSIEI
ncbi:MAG: ribonuclease Z [Acidimicrobiales bacterium mtb01]|nr:ribonuclease Z [Actinomycetota bacterium]TEX47403.1 MAG: ribonuclease Z [Acidimicrobiales bacterium mtb01]